jgi:hypothetical protein
MDYFASGNLGDLSNSCIIMLRLVLLLKYRACPFLAGDLYRLMTEEQRAHLVSNIVGAMKPVERDEIKLRQIEHFYKADPEYGTRIAEGLGLSVPETVK